MTNKRIARRNLHVAFHGALTRIAGAKPQLRCNPQGEGAIAENRLFFTTQIKLIIYYVHLSLYIN